MNVNPLKQIWQSGKTVIGTYIMYSRDVTTVELAAAAGLDFVVFDLEHRPHSIETVHDLCQVARLAGLSVLVGPSDIASAESTKSIELRTRDRERKLINKINEALERIENNTYGYCEITGKPIGLKRLEARPIATLSIEAQQMHENEEELNND